MTLKEFATPERILISNFVENHILNIEDENEFQSLIFSILWKRAAINGEQLSDYALGFIDKMTYIIIKRGL